MGGGSWSRDSFKTYSKSVGRSVSMDGSLAGDYRAQDMFTSRSLAPELNPKKVIRECVDSAEHPDTKPVILALDVTGSMGSAAVEVAKQINIVMTELYDKVKDVEFLVMGIGDLSYDHAPIQASQFESDIRIAEQLDKVYFEGGGGGNDFESYTAAWYFGLHHTKLDCLKRGKKGVIITMGDEPLNPYLPARALGNVIGDNIQANIETSDLYAEASEKFDIYHLNVKHGSTRYQDKIHSTFGQYLDKDHLRDTTVNGITNDIIDIVTNAFKATPMSMKASPNVTVSSEGISW